MLYCKGPMRYNYQALPGLLPSTSAGYQPLGSLSLDHTQHHWPPRLRQGPWEGKPLVIQCP